ncbi:MAG: DUF1837 domain-containing protein [Chloroflexi bacterium]|nr:MAG: DUF1837 domain-containing protein [Chloroflexota bacterium]
MTVPFVLTDKLDFDEHHFRVYEPNGSPEADWLSPLAQEYIELLTHRETAPRKIIINQSDLQMDVSRIQKYLKKASIPKYKAGNFNVVRSDFGELLCYMILERDYGTSFGAKSICHRELRDSTGRGIDAIGIELDNEGLLTLVLCEVKVSDEKKSPPHVVDDSEDSLGKQHRHHLDNLDEATKDKVWRAMKFTKDQDTADLLTRAAICLEEKQLGKLRIIISSVLIRPKTKYTQADFGSFRKKPSKYDPATIRFLVACIPADTDVIINKWYDVVEKTEAPL